MAAVLFNKYRVAIEILQRGRDVLVEGMADEILDHEDDLADGGFQFNEFLESQGTRLHFLSLLVGQLELSADVLDEILTAPPSPPPTTAETPRKRARTKPKKIQSKVPAENSPDDV